MPDVTRTVQITQDDITNGKPKNCSYCPGALAISNSFPEAKYVEVMDLEVRLYFPHSDRTRETFEFQTKESPVSLKEFVAAFDGNKEVQPISFDLTFNLEAAECSSPSQS